jgi:protein-tyrosine phosphatase
VIACWLAASEGLTPADAIAAIRAVRPHSVETVEQEECVRRFAERFGEEES